MHRISNNLGHRGEFGQEFNEMLTQIYCAMQNFKNQNQFELSS